MSELQNVLGYIEIPLPELNERDGAMRNERDPPLSVKELQSIFFSNKDARKHRYEQSRIALYLHHVPAKDEAI